MGGSPPSSASAPSTPTLVGLASNLVPPQMRVARVGVGSMLSWGSTASDVPNNGTAENVFNAGCTAAGTAGSAFTAAWTICESTGFNDAMRTLRTYSPGGIYGSYRNFITPGLSVGADRINISPDHPEYARTVEVFNQGQAAVRPPHPNSSMQAINDLQNRLLVENQIRSAVQALPIDRRYQVSSLVGAFPDIPVSDTLALVNQLANLPANDLAHLHGIRGLPPAMLRTQMATLGINVPEPRSANQP